MTPSTKRALDLGTRRAIHQWLGRGAWRGMAGQRSGERGRGLRERRIERRHWVGGTHAIGKQPGRTYVADLGTADAWICGRDGCAHAWF
jgi:hypothetical protein